VKTANLPHGHSAPRFRRVLRLALALALAAGSLPALAMNPAISKADPVSQTAPSAAASVLALPAPAAIATPDTAPLSAQLAILQKAKDAPTSPSLVKTVLQRAISLLGTPYRWGGSSPESGFDCSGLVGYVFRTIGIDLPRVSRAMADEGTKVASRDALAEGDLVFFGKRGHIDHVGIYVGEGKFVHAPRTGRDVTVSSLTSGYWAQKYLEARRLATGS
jgi:cell wall-associated NlpC family hydrolase